MCSILSIGVEGKHADPDLIHSFVAAADATTVREFEQTLSTPFMAILQQDVSGESWPTKEVSISGTYQYSLL
jgi:hypothetical protein